jgi:hypothetical protein
MLIGCSKSEPKAIIDPARSAGYIDMTSYTQADLYEAIRNNDINKFKTILSKDVDPNYYFSEDTWDSRPGIIALAVMHRQDLFLKAALASRGDPNALAKSGLESVSFIAIDSNDLVKLKLLIEHGANIDASDASGYTLFHKAVQVRRFEIANYLYENGADTQTPDQWGYAPLVTMRKYEARGLLDQKDEAYLSVKRKLIRDETTIP